MRCGVSPKCAPTVFDLPNRAESLIVALTVKTVTGPTPGMRQ
jgi:hypothetical protein